MKKDNLIIGMLVFCLGLISIGVFSLVQKKMLINEPVEVVEQAPETVVEEPVETHNSFRIFMVGDGLLHGAVYKAARQADGTYDFNTMIWRMGNLARQYDIAYYNQETILGGTELGLAHYPRFNSPQEFGENMVGNGFNMVSLATNHCLDKDEEGILRSMAFWNSQPVVKAGTYLSWEEQQAMPVYECNGITYTYINYTYGTNGLYPPAGKEYLVNVYTPDNLLADIERANGMSDVVIVAIHWGTEYQHDPNSEQIELAQRMADAGADVIIGTHPHVIQPVEWIGDSICFYSLGNMISAQEDTEKLIGMMGEVTVNKDCVNGECKISVSDPRADLCYTYYTRTYKDFEVIPFYDLDEEHLPNHEAIYEQFKPIITRRDSSITVGLSEY